MKMYMVGGAVRDEILGSRTKDIDFTCVLEDADIAAYQAHNSFTPFEYMEFYLRGLGFEIFLSTPQFLTVRARFPKDHPEHRGLTADFVLARKESNYIDGRRPDHVEPGTLFDDLSRRDFTMNAIASNDSGEYIDPFNGLSDIQAGIIRAVGNPHDRLEEDALRAVRAVRFSITKKMSIDANLEFAINSAAVLDKVANNVSDERIREELNKMLAFDSLQAGFVLFGRFSELTRAMLSGKVSLEATMRKR